MVTHISNSPGETEALGEAWGRAAQSGLVIGLTGDLGAGKTQLVKGLARGLDISARIQSPTFALVNIYAEGRLPLYHLDLYRLETREQIAAAGLDDYLEPEGVTVIEWAERLEIRRPKSELRKKSEIRNPRSVLSPQSTAHSPESEAAIQHPESSIPNPASSSTQHATRNTLFPRIRLVRIETLSGTERRITYEDSGD